MLKEAHSISSNAFDSQNYFSKANCNSLGSKISKSIDNFGFFQYLSIISVFLVTSVYNSSFFMSSFVFDLILFTSLFILQRRCSSATNVSETLEEQNLGQNQVLPEPNYVSPHNLIFLVYFLGPASFFRIHLIFHVLLVTVFGFLFS